MSRDCLCRQLWEYLDPQVLRRTQDLYSGHNLLLQLELEWWRLCLDKMARSLVCWFLYRTGFDQRNSHQHSSQRHVAASYKSL